MTTPRLFEPEASSPPVDPSVGPPDGRIARVVVDVGAVRGEFDYVVPDRFADDIGIGDQVRVPFGGRRVRAWVVALDVRPPPGIELADVARRTGLGPPADVVELCRWAAWRWAGRLPSLLGVASPPSVVRGAAHPAPPEGAVDAGGRWVAPLADPGSGELRRRPPSTPVGELVDGLTGHGDLLVVCPDATRVRSAISELAALGVRAVAHPDGWARAARGCTVVGTRTAVFAPMPRLGAIVVVDEHDELLTSERSPTWNVRDLALRRGRQRGVPVVMTSPCPSVDALEALPLDTPPRAVERSGWAVPRAIDPLDDASGRRELFSAGLVRLLRGPGTALCVLNRVGRAALLACDSCRALQRCSRCDAGLRQPDDETLLCARCGAARPVVCQECGSRRMKRLRLGVSRAAEELEALLREPVAEVTADAEVGSSATRVSIGTEAVLHRRRSADLVAFLDFDQELLAPRYRAGERAMALLASASRIVGPRRGGGTVVVQTTMAGDPVIRAWLASDPGRAADADADRRRALGLPPFGAVAVIGGEGAPAFVGSLPDEPGVERLERGEGEWMVIAPDASTLADHLAGGVRGPGRLRLAVDPVRLSSRRQS